MCYSLSSNLNVIIFSVYGFQSKVAPDWNMFFLQTKNKRLKRNFTAQTSQYSNA